MGYSALQCSGNVVEVDILNLKTVLTTVRPCRV